MDSLRLVVDCGQARALMCVLLANALKTDGVNISIETSDDKSALRDISKQNQKSDSPPYNPAEANIILYTAQGNIHGPRCIYSYLETTLRSKHKAFLLNPDISDQRRNYWVNIEWIDWCMDKFQRSLEGVNRQSIIDHLNFLETQLESIKSTYLVGNQTSVADMFIYAALRWNRYGISNIKDWPQLFNFFSRMESETCVQRTLSQFPAPVLSRFPIRRYTSTESACDLKTNERFYLTTAINYTNGVPHMGHVYEGITSDAIARCFRMYGKQVYFVTGTDEHGQKIANTAASKGVLPIQICDEYSSQFKALNTALNVSNDYFIRTTMDSHKEVCQWVWKKAQDNGDIYLDSYVGWYNEREETFVSENEAKLAGYKDVQSGKPLQKMEEPSYFFRLSKYQTRLIQHINDNPDFIQPEERRKDVLRRLEEPLQDLSCSRTSFDWGVPVPNDSKHVMYVWFDALTNYLSACDPLQKCDQEKIKFWPANVHIIGKDIVWFHCVIWPCILYSIGIELPKHIFAHGFVTGPDGEKMSKSLGNVVDPYDILKEYPSDTFRYYLVKEARFGSDLHFDKSKLFDVHNADLADTLGNFIHRTTSLCVKNCNGQIPNVSAPEGPAPFDVLRLVESVYSNIQSFQLREALESAIAACRDANKYLTDWAPWSIQDETLKIAVIRMCLESAYILAHVLEPFIPTASSMIFEKLGATKKSNILELSPMFDNLIPGTHVTVGAVLFEKKQIESAKHFFQKLEMCTGTIMNISPHQKNETVSILDIQLKGTTRRAVVPISLNSTGDIQPLEFVGKNIIVVCNIKPTVVGGVQSQVFPLITKEKNHIQPIFVNSDITPGTPILTKAFPPIIRKCDVFKAADIQQQLSLTITKDKTLCVDGNVLISDCNKTVTIGNSTYIEDKKLVLHS